MQSWQADIANTALSISVRPALARAKSVRNIRRGVKLFDRLAGRAMMPRGVNCEPVQATNTHCALEWLTAENSKEATDSPVVLYLPGGAYVLRTPNLHRALVARLCRSAVTRSLICFYRLAPEHPFPACLDDAVAAYKLLLSEGVPASKIIVAGDSAGGGLALSLLLKLRDTGLPMPQGAVLISPLLDMAEHAPSRSKNAHRDAALPPASHRGINPRKLFLAEEACDNPLASPIHGELHDLPPCYVLVSDSEMLLDDSLRLARRAHQYRMSVKLDIWHKLPHVWVAVPWLPESSDALLRIASFINEISCSKRG